jgi:hypothetical protein
MGQFYVRNGYAGNQVKIYRAKYFYHPLALKAFGPLTKVLEPRTDLAGFKLSFAALCLCERSIFFSPVRFAHSSRKARKERLIVNVYTPDYFTKKDTKSTKGSADELWVMSDELRVIELRFIGLYSSLSLLRSLG